MRVLADRRLACGIVMTVIATLLAIGPTARAEVTSSVVAGELIVSGDTADDDVVIGCGNDGEVKINRARPDSGAVRCDGITSITIGVGAGFDEIRLARVGPADFSSLTSVSIDAGSQPDEIEASQFTDTIVGGSGQDEILIDTASDLVDGGDGKDRVVASVAGDVGISDETYSLSPSSFFG